MQQFASGWKRSYYGKGDVIVYRLNRDAAATGSQSPVFGASVLMLIYGDAFWPTYTTGDNTGIIATDSMKNFIQRETLNFAGSDLEDFCWFLGATFLDTYPQVEGVQISAVEIPYAGLDGGVGFAPSGPQRATARIELRNRTVVEAVSGFRGFRLLRLSGSAFYGFVRDQFTTLPDLHDRPLHMGLDLEWSYTSPTEVCNDGRASGQVRRIVHDVFQAFESGSIQQVIYQMGTRILNDIPSIAEVHLEANNRTWDTITERSGEGGVYTDPRPPYGCLGLRLRR
jgi:urate oxidase/2-oxo-4-hydroxy-4-carboxy-5-ureidoimidazoline decarboxylase